jgi:hypothetical protein
MSATPGTTAVPMTLRLSEQARAKLAERAAARGQDPAGYASELIEQAVARPSVDEVLAPFRKQVDERGMSDAELDEFLRGELDAARRERKAERG